MELGTKFRLFERLWVLAYLAACTEHVVSCWLGLQSRFGRHAQLPLLLQWLGRNSFVRLLQLQVGSPILESSQSEWPASIWNRFVLLNVGYVVDNGDTLYRSEKYVMFLAILALARTVIWMTQKKRLYEGAKFSHCDLIMFFRHQHRVKIWCDRKCLGHITFDRRWVYAVILVIWKDARLESFSPPLHAHGVNGLGPSGLHPQ